MKPSEKPSPEASVPLAPSTAEPQKETLAQHLRTIAGAVFLAIVIRTCIAEPFDIECPSMEPTLLSGDRVVVEKFRYGLYLPLRDHADINWSSPDPGDVIVLRSPADGVDIIKVKELLGHAHITTTQIYDKRRRSTSESASHLLAI